MRSNYFCRIVPLSIALLLATAASAEAGHLRYVNTTSELERAVAYADPGDEIVVDGGWYSVNLRITRDGTSDEPITLRAARGERVTLSARESSRRVLDLDGASHWRFERLRMRGSRHAIVKIDGGTDNVIRDCVIYDGTKKGIIANGDRITIEDSTIRDIKQSRGGDDTQGIAIWRGSRIRIRRNFIATPGDGVLLGGAGELGRTPTDVRIYRNHFHTRNWWYDKYNVENAIDVKDGEHVIITDNVIHNYRARQADAGVMINLHTVDYEQDDDEIDYVRIERNRFYDAARAVVATEVHGPVEDLIFRRNVVYNVLYDYARSDKRPGAVFIGAWDDARIDNNTFVDVEGKVLYAYSSRADGVRFRNNIIRRSAGVELDGGGYVDYSCRYSSSSTGGDNDVVDNQEFVDDSDRDYRLRSSSPCIDEGIDVGLWYAGGDPDMGRYEYTRDDNLEMDEGDAPAPPPDDGRPVDWAAEPADDSELDQELGPEVTEDTSAKDEDALQEEASPPPRADADEEVPPGAGVAAGAPAGGGETAPAGGAPSPSVVPAPGRSSSGCAIGVGGKVGGTAAGTALVLLGGVAVVVIRRRARRR